MAKLFGANKKYIEMEIPHISSLLVDKLDDIISFSDLIVIGNRAEEFLPVLNGRSDDKIIFDLVRIIDAMKRVPSGYDGICW